MNRHQWAKMPCYWQTDTRMHRHVAAATTGIAIAALKLFIGLCAKAAFNPTSDLASGTVRVSITDLGRLVGVSKPTAYAPYGCCAAGGWWKALRVDPRCTVYRDTTTPIIGRKSRAPIFMAPAPKSCGGSPACHHAAKLDDRRFSSIFTLPRSLTEHLEWLRSHTTR